MSSRTFLINSNDYFTISRPSVFEFAHYHIIGVRVIIFHSPETFINSELKAVIVNDRFHFFLEKKWSKKIGLRNKS